MRRLGIDPGDRRVGVARSDEDGLIATPLETVDAQRAVSRIATLAVELEVGEIVVGLPLRLNGLEGPASQKARRLAKALEDATKLPVVLFDERLTTALAERSLREARVKGKARRNVVDQAAATVLLQSYLDSKRGGSAWRDDDDPL